MENNINDIPDDKRGREIYDKDIQIASLKKSRNRYLIVMFACFISLCAETFFVFFSHSPSAEEIPTQEPQRDTPKSMPHHQIPTGFQIMNFSDSRLYFRYSYNLRNWIVESVDDREQTEIYPEQDIQTLFIEVCQNVQGKTCDTITLKNRRRYIVVRNATTGTLEIREG